nr:septal ring lytic transglycosylase RlpA family protein [uncultured Rhodopila sp.]
MRKYYAIAVIAASSLLATSHHGALARTASKHHHRSAAPSTSSADRPDAAFVGETGTASYYSNAYHGRRAADGSRFDQRLLTAAHAWLPFGTKLKVTLASTGQSVVVTVTDRIYSARRIVDLSAAAARELGMMRSGIARVSLTPV